MLGGRHGPACTSGDSTCGRSSTCRLGYFPSAEPIWQRLLRDGFSADEIRASNLLADSRLPGRLVGPIRDGGRRIISFWAKQQPDLAHCLYLSSEWKERAGLFGIDVALPTVAGGRQDMLVVEDLWDALLLHSHGYAAVAAIGNSPAEIGLQRWERLDELGIHRVTLVVDSFHDSHEAAMAAIRQAAAARRGPAVYVLPPAAVHGAWQSWQQGRAAHPETIERLLAAHRIHGFHYLALGLIALAKGEGPWTDASRRVALAEGAEVLRRRPSAQRAATGRLLPAAAAGCAGAELERSRRLERFLAGGRPFLQRQRPG